MGIEFKNVGEYAIWLAGQVGVMPAAKYYPVELNGIKDHIEFVNKNNFNRSDTLTPIDNDIFLAPPNDKTSHKSTKEDIEKDLIRPGAADQTTIPFYKRSSPIKMDDLSEEDFSAWHLENYGQNWTRLFSSMSKQIGYRNVTSRASTTATHASPKMGPVRNIEDRNSSDSNQSPKSRSFYTIESDEDSDHNHYVISTKTAAMGLYEHGDEKYFVVIEKDLELKINPGDPDATKIDPIPGHVISIYRYVEGKGYVIDSVNGSNDFARSYMARHEEMVNIEAVEKLRQDTRRTLFNVAVIESIQKYNRPSQRNKDDAQTNFTTLTILYALKLLSDRIYDLPYETMTQIVEEANKKEKDMLEKIGSLLNTMTQQITDLSSYATGLQTQGEKELWKGAAWLIFSLTLLTFTALAGLEFLDWYKVGLDIESWVVNKDNQLGGLATAVTGYGALFSGYQSYSNIKSGRAHTSAGDKAEEAAKALTKNNDDSKKHESGSYDQVNTPGGGPGQQ